MLGIAVILTLVFLVLHNQITTFVAGIPADSVQKWKSVLNRDTDLSQSEALRAICAKFNFVLALLRIIDRTQCCTKLTS